MTYVHCPNQRRSDHRKHRGRMNPATGACRDCGHQLAIYPREHPSGRDAFASVQAVYEGVTPND